MEKARKNAIRVPARASLWYIASSALQRGIALLATPIFTRLLSAEQYGLLPLYNTWLGIVSVIGTLEITGGITLSGLQRFDKRRGEFLTATLGLAAGLLSIICAVLVLLRKRLGEITGLGSLVMLLPLQALLVAAGSLYTQGLKYEYKYREAASLGIGSAIAAPVTSLILITALGADARWRVAGTFAAAFVAAVPAIIMLLRGGGRLFSAEIWKFLLKLAVPLLPHYLAVSLMLRAPEIAIGRVLGTDELAKYSVSAALGFGASIITGGILSALGPWMLRRIAGGRAREIPLLLQPVFRAVGVICLIILAFAPELMALVAPREYGSALGVAYPIMLAALPMLISSVVSQGLSYLGRGAASSLPAVAGALVSIVFSAFLIPRIGIIAAGIGVFASYTTLALFGIRLYRRSVGVSPIDVRRMITSLGIFSAIALVIYLFRGSFAARALLAAALVGAFLPEGTRFLAVIRESDGD